MCASRIRAAGLYAVLVLSVALGLFGRDPWKPDEAYTFGLVHNILATGDWVVPTLAGEPFMEKPPLFFVSAATFARLFGGLLSLADAARLASGFYVALTVAFIALTARRLYGGGALACALMLLGCLGFCHPAHLLLTDNALVAGVAAALYGLSLSQERPLLGGMVLGTGTGVAFLSKGLIGPGMIGLTALALGLFPEWRTRAYARALVAATLAAAPWLLVWPWLLYQRSPELFRDWLLVNNFGRYVGTAKLGPARDHLLYLWVLPWFALPALPLAATAAWRANVHRIALPLVASLIMLAVLSAASSARELYALPMLVPLSLLAVAAEPPPRLARGLRAVAILGAALTGCALWSAWLVLVSGRPELVAGALLAARPGFQPTVQAGWLALAIVLTLAWALAVLSSPRGLLGIAAAWTGAVALGWGLLCTLWLPYQNYGNSYRWVVARLEASLPADARCIASRGLGEPQRAMLEYFAGIDTYAVERRPEAARCDVLLVQQLYTDMPSVGATWKLRWSGSRAGDRGERLWLFVRGAALVRKEHDHPGASAAAPRAKLTPGTGAPRSARSS
jgi:4-amino-4-deoxy-L-arabinose transferase-like glycosyltransferase